MLAPALPSPPTGARAVSRTSWEVNAANEQKTQNTHSKAKSSPGVSAGWRQLQVPGGEQQGGGSVQLRQPQAEVPPETALTPLSWWGLIPGVSL